jgi:uncharacterized protein
MPELFVLALPVLISAFVLGLTGFGFGLVGIGVAALLIEDMEQAAAVLTMTATLVVAVLAWRASRHGAIRWREVLMLLLFTSISQPLGYAFIAWAGDRPVFRISLGLVLIVFALMGWRGARTTRPIARRWAPPLGLLSGFISGAFVSGGPPLVVYLYSREPADPRRMVASLQMLFLCNCLVRMAICAWRGYLSDPATMTAVGLALPGGLLALFAGYGLSRRLPPQLFVSLAYGLVLIMGVLAIVRALPQLG